MNKASPFHFQTTYSDLPAAFFSRVKPEAVSHPESVLINERLVGDLGLDTESIHQAVPLLAGNGPSDDSLAMAYAGHQFGGFTMLGDGRAHLLGEILDPEGQRWDIQLKGSGRTPYSRGGDGRASLEPMLREYLISESMAALGVPTTRSLAVVATGETVYRETPLPGAILTRVAASHIRVGTFQWAACQKDPGYIKQLLDYAIQRHYLDCAQADRPALAFFEAVRDQQIKTVVEWMRVGFVHGVMNTDNMAISGETIDYGPCAFIDAYDPMAVFSSIDQHGRYAFANQAKIAKWNLIRLLETLVPLVDPDPKVAIALAQEAIDQFDALYNQQWLSMMRGKLGLGETQEDVDSDLIEDLLDWMHQNNADYTQTFRALSSGNLPEPEIFHQTAFDNWYTCWLARLAQGERTPEAIKAQMTQMNPAIIPRNHLVEAALNSVSETGDLSKFNPLVAALTTPYKDSLVGSEYDCLPPETSVPYQTFCGT